LEHPAWLISSPEYNGSYTALLKNNDWCPALPVRPGMADGFHTSVVVSVPRGAGWFGGHSYLAPVAEHAVLVAPKAFALGNAGDALDKDGKLRQLYVKSVQGDMLLVASRLAD
jgi:NAD(P)H-dependent FMN reductase